MFVFHSCCMFAKNLDILLFARFHGTHTFEKRKSEATFLKKRKSEVAFLPSWKMWCHINDQLKSYSQFIRNGKRKAVCPLHQVFYKCKQISQAHAQSYRSKVAQMWTQQKVLQKKFRKKQARPWKNIFSQEGLEFFLGRADDLQNGKIVKKVIQNRTHRTIGMKRRIWFTMVIWGNQTILLNCVQWGTQCWVKRRLGEMRVEWMICKVRGKEGQRVNI